MNVMIQQPAARETERMQANREELVERVARAMRQDGTAQPLPGLHLHRHSVPMARVHGVVEPSLCVVAQGSKEYLSSAYPEKMKRIALERKEYANDVCIAHYFAAGDTYVSLPLPGRRGSISESTV